MQCPFNKLDVVLLACAIVACPKLEGKQKEMATKKTAAKVEVTPASAREVREWALAKGLDVAPKGRIPASVHEAFTADTGRPYVVAASPAKAA